MYPSVESDHVQDKAVYQEQSSQVLSNLISDESINDLLYRNSREAIVQLTSIEGDEVSALSSVDKWRYFNRIGFALMALEQYEASEDAYAKAIEVAESAGEVWNMLESYIDAATTLIHQNKLPEAEVLLDKAENLSTSFPEIKFRGFLKSQLGYLQLHYYNPSRAQEYFLEAQRLFSANEEHSLKANYYLTRTYAGIGKVHEGNGSYGLSAKAYQVAYDIAKANRLSMIYPHTALMLSKVLIQNEQVAEAEELLDVMVEYKGEVSTTVKSGLLANLGLCRLESKAYHAAQSLLEEGKEGFLGSSKDHAEELFDIERWLARLHMALNDYERAGEYLQSAFQYAQSIKGFRALSTVYKEIADFYSKTKNYESAYEYSMLYNQAIENYYEELSDQKRYEVEIKYETELKEKEAEYFELQAAKLQLKALRAQMNPHFIYNALNAIQHFISSKRDKDAATYLAKFAVLMRKSLDYSDREVITLEDEIAFINDYLEINQKLRFEDAMKYRVDVDEDLEDDIIGIPSMIVQPYVENAIEHGIRMKSDGFVHIAFQHFDDEHILCVIEDNGIGRKAAAAYKAQKEDLQSYESKGTKITEQRLQLINKTSQRHLYVRTIDLLDDANNPSGTRVEIRIPISEML